MNDHFGCKLFPADSNVRFFEQEVNSVEQIDDYNEKNLDNQVLICGDDKDCNKKFVENAYKRGANLCWAYSCLQIEGQNPYIIYLWLPTSPQVYLILLVCKIIVLIVYHHNFLVRYEIISLLQCQVCYRRFCT
jgi:hypothetical protein